MARRSASKKIAFFPSVVLCLLLVFLTAATYAQLTPTATISTTVYDPVAHSQSSAASSVLGQSVTVTLTVSAPVTPPPAPPTPTGVAYFYDNAGLQLLGIAQLDATGNAYFSTSILPPGSHALSAIYQGDATYKATPSHGTYAFTVNVRPAVVVVHASPNPVGVGQTSIVTGSVADAATTDNWYPTAPGAFTAANNSPSYNLQSLCSGHAATLQSDGSVLISGGTVAGVPVKTVEAYSAISGRFANVSGNLRSARSGHTSTLLSDGLTTLISGGDDAGDAELYTYNFDGTGSSLLTGSMIKARWSHTATSLGGGMVLMVGGTVNGSATNTVELYGGGSFVPMTGTLAYPRSGHTTTLLASSGSTYTLLVAGGDATGTAELIQIDVGSRTVAQIGSATWLTSRTGHTATLLLDGTTVLFTGGVQAGARVSSAELYAVPSTLTSFTLFSTVSAPSPLNIARSGHTATLVNSDFVLLTGGESDSTPPTQSAEFYLPAFGPQGSVAFSSDDPTDTVDGCNLVLSGTGTSSCTTPLIPYEVGNPRNIVAMYTGDGIHLSGVIGFLAPALTVTKGAQATVTASVPAVASYGQPGLSAVASGGNGTGAYVYSASGGCSVQPNTGALTITASSGTCSIVATRNGDANYNDSAPSAPATILLGKSVPSISVLKTTPTGNPAYGQSVGVQMTLTPSTATGTVAFVLDGGSPSTVNVSGGVASINFPLLTGGAHTVVATYSGDTNYSGGSGSVALNVQKFADAVALTSSLPSSGTGQSVTFTATLNSAPNGAPPTGNVQFMDGANTVSTAALNGSGVATYTTTTLTVGTHAMTAVYAGDANYAGATSSAVTQTVVTPDFNLTASPLSVTITRGSSGSITINGTSVGGFSTALTPSCGGLPLYASCSFAPAVMNWSNGTTTSTLTVHTAPVTTSALQGSHGMMALAVLTFGVPGMLLFANRRKLTKQAVFATLLLLSIAITLGLVACGSSPHDTPAGSYTVPVTITGGTTNHVVNVTIIVK